MSCVLDRPGMEPLGGCGQGQEAGRVKEPEYVHIKEEPETWDCQYEDLVKEEAWCVDEVGQEPSCSETAGSCGASSAAMLAGLYADHTVKDELVLGPELPHRPTVTPVFRVGAESAVSLRARRQLAAACAVRLERLRAPPAPARRASAQHTYACDMCTQRLYSKSVLIRHIGTHYRCVVCDKTFMMSACLTRHERNCTQNKLIKYKLAENSTLLKSHGEVIMYYCDECGQGFRYKHYLRKHIQRSHMIRQVLYNSHSRLFNRQVRVTQKSNTDQKPFHCSQCVNKCNKKSNLRTHQSIHTGEKLFECDYCDLKCSDKSNFRWHQRIHTGGKQVKCDNCDYKCRYKSDLQRHQRIHTGEKPFECGYCDFKFSDKSNFQTHQRIHTGLKPFECGYCDFKCSDKSSIKRHQRTHTGEKQVHTGGKQVKCDNCDYKCRYKSALQRHQRIHTGEKPFECGYCVYKCSDKSSIKRHQRTHTGEKQVHTGGKQVKCDNCDYKCRYKSALQRHQRIHTGEKPFECGYCDYKCSYKSYLQMHEMKHTGEKPFQCGYCNHKYRWKKSLRRHVMIHL